MTAITDVERAAQIYSHCCFVSRDDAIKFIAAAIEDAVRAERAKFAELDWKLAEYEAATNRLESRIALLEGADSAWRPINTAPKDRPILAWCDHEADPYFIEEGHKLTLYGAHAEGLSHAATGMHIVEWGGGFDDSTHEDPGAGWLPDWWFVAGSEFEVAANPICWLPLPEPP